VSDVAAQPFAGTYVAQPTASTFAFAVRHSDTFWFRGRVPEVEARLGAGGDGLVLEGSARVESISIEEPEAMREHVLGPDFFDTGRHPEVTFRSTDIRLLADDRVELDGELTIAGITRPVSAGGRYTGTRQVSFGAIAALELHTTIDRRDFGFDWQMELPNGGLTLSWEVQLDIDLLLIREAPNGDA
jgi:polyisoprenoid-binding protein YceI